MDVSERKEEKCINLRVVIVNKSWFKVISFIRVIIVLLYKITTRIQTYELFILMLTDV